MTLARPRTAGASLLALALTLVTLATGRPSAAAASAPVRVNADTEAARTHASPSLAANPQRAGHLVVVDVKRTAAEALGVCMAHVSEDGGETWAGTELPRPAGTLCKKQPGPRVAFAGDGSVVAAYPVQIQSAPAPGTTGASWIVVSRSTDGGATFLAPTTVPGSVLEQPEPYAGANLAGPSYGVAITADPASTDVYVAYEAFPEPAIWVVRSQDAGVSFGTPTAVVPPAVEAANHPRVLPFLLTPSIVALRGVVYLAFDWAYACERYSDLINGSRCLWGIDVMFTKSTDAGATFETPRHVKYTVSYDTNARFVPIPSLAVDAERPGHIFIAYEDSAEGTLIRNVWVVRSIDGGATFQPPVRLSDDPLELGYPHTRPAISVAPGGRLHAAWYDGRNDPRSQDTACPPSPQMCGGRDVYYTYSVDGGQSFAPNVRLTPNTFSAKTRRIGQGQNDMLGSVGLATTPTAAHVVWEQSADFESKVWDLYAARVSP